MKSVLVLDDEVDLAEAVASSLETSGFKADCCASVDEALVKLGKNKFDLIISDINMPHKDGLYFFNQIKEDIKSKNMPFVFMTGQTENISIQKAYDMGVDEFVSKPFDLEDLNSIVHLLLQSEVKTYSDNEKFYKIQLTEFLLSSVNEYDVYLKVNNNYLCLARKGHELLPERLVNYYKKGMEYIYLTSEGFAKYVGMQVEISEVVKLKPIAKLKKVKLFNHFCKTISESALNQQMDEELYTKAFSSFENYSQINLESNEIFNLMSNLNINNPDASSKSVIVSFLVLGVFHNWKWTHPKHLSRVVLATLMCDVGLPPELNNKKLHEMNSEELKEYEKHPLQGYLFLSKIKNIPEEVLQVVLQHHENEAGLGFPQKTPKLKLHAYSRVIHTLFEFVEQVEDLKSKSSIQECLDRMLSLQKKLISIQTIKTLYLIFNLPVPLELVNTLLPTDTTRLT